MTTTTEPTRYKVPACRFDEVQAAFLKLHAKAERLHLTPPVLTTVATGTDIITKRNWLGEPVRFEVPWVELIATGEPPVFDGWRLLGVVQHVEGHTIIRGVPGHAIPERYREADPRNCDHCHAVRNRRDSIIVQHVDGRTLQLGTDCAQGYLPSADVETLLGYMVAMLDAVGRVGTLSSSDDDAGYWHRGSSRTNLIDFLRFTVRIIRAHGWVSRSAAGAAEPTADAVLRYIDGPAPGAGEATLRWFERTSAATRDDEQPLAEATIAFWQSATGTSDYVYNLRSIAAIGWVDERLAGLAASMVPGYQKVRDEEAAANAKPSQHVGTVGKRTRFQNLTSTVRYFDGDYGTRAQVTFRDEAGAILIWWTQADCASIDIRLLEDPARRWDVTGTIKKHDRFKGIAQTILTRCAVVEAAKAEAAA